MTEMKCLERCRELADSRRGRRIGVMLVGLGLVCALVHLAVNQAPDGETAGNASPPPLERSGADHPGSPPETGNGVQAQYDRIRSRAGRFLDGGEDVKTFADYLVSGGGLIGSKTSEFLAEHQDDKWSEISALVSELTGREGTKAWDAVSEIVQNIKGLPARLDLVDNAFHARARNHGYLFVVATGRVDDTEGLWTNLERFPPGLAQERAARGYLNAALKSAGNVPLAVTRAASVEAPDLRQISLGNLRSGALALVEEGKLEKQTWNDLVEGATLTAREKEYLLTP